MGVMNKMRDNMAAIMIFLVVVFVLTMSVGGLVGGANIMDVLSGNRPNAFTVINGEEISRESFVRALQNERDNFRQRSGAEPTEEQLIQITDQVWENMVNQVLMRQAVEEENISVSEEEIRYFFTENIHPSVRQYFTNDNGQFDINAYQNAISAPEAANFFTALRAQVAAIVPIEKLQQRVTSAAHVSEAEVRAEYIKQNMSYDLDYIVVKTNHWNDDDFAFSDDELKSYYNSHLEDYQQEESRKMLYVDREVKTTAYDTSRALNLINDIKTEAQGGADFASLAQIHSDGPSAQDGGYLGWFSKGKMVKEFEDAAFSAPVGKVVGPVLTQFGYHLIQVENTRPATGEIEARHILVEIRPSESTRDKLRRELKNLEFLAEELGFQSALDSLGFEAKVSNPVKKTDSFVFGLGSFQSAVQFAFLNDVGDFSPVLQNATHFAIFSLTEINPAGNRPFEEVKSSISRKLTIEARREKAAEYAQSLLPALAADTDWAAVAESDDKAEFKTVEGAQAVGSIQGLGRYLEIFGFLANAEIGEVSDVIETPQGGVIVRLIAKTDIDESDYMAQRQQLFNRLLAQRQTEIWENYVQSLRDKAEILDNRLRML